MKTENRSGHALFWLQFQLEHPFPRVVLVDKSFQRHLRPPLPGLLVRVRLLPGYDLRHAGEDLADLGTRELLSQNKFTVWVSVYRADLDSKKFPTVQVHHHKETCANQDKQRKFPANSRSAMHRFAGNFRLHKYSRDDAHNYTNTDQIFLAKTLPAAEYSTPIGRTRTHPARPGPSIAEL